MIPRTKRQRWQKRAVRSLGLLLVLLAAACGRPEAPKTAAVIGPSTGIAPSSPGATPTYSPPPVASREPTTTGVARQALAAGSAVAGTPVPSSTPGPTFAPSPTPGPEGVILFNSGLGEIFATGASCVCSGTGCSQAKVQLLNNQGLPPGTRATAWPMSASPDGRYVAFAYLEERKPGFPPHTSVQILDIRACSALPAGCRVDQTLPLLNDPGQDTAQPAWSPTDGAVAFELRSDTFYGLALKVVGGLTWQPLLPSDRIASDASIANPDWSPDGTRLAFDAAWGGARHADTYLYSVKRDGSELDQLTQYLHLEPFEQRDWEPRWSPDGRKILFASNHRHEGWQEDPSVDYLYVMNADGSDITPLGIERVGATWWDWWPDGRILYTTHGQICLAEAIQGAPTQCSEVDPPAVTALWAP